jgi:hypothetical protein
MEDVAQQLNMDRLRAQLESEQREKATLLNELTAASTTAKRKYEAIFRHYIVVSDLRKIARDLDMFESRR